MSTELESFVQFLREKLANGEAEGTPEQMLHRWRESGARGRLPSGGDQTETLFDRLGRKGLLGTVNGGPCDLSTNPSHMEGFGES